MRAYVLVAFASMNSALSLQGFLKRKYKKSLRCRLSSCEIGCAEKHRGQIFCLYPSCRKDERTATCGML